MAVLSLTDAKIHLNITVATFDAELTAFIAAAESAIGKKVGPLEAVARTVRVRPVGRALIVRPPLATLTSVTDSSGVALTVANLHFATASGVITYSDGQSFTARWYDVVHTHGWASCPSDLVLAVKELVRHLFDTQRGPARRPGSTASDTVANTVPGAPYVFPFRVTQLLAPYVLPGSAV